MIVNRHDLFPVPVWHIEGFLPHEVSKDIFDFIIEDKDKIKPGHSAFIGDVISYHSNVQDSNGVKQTEKFLEILQNKVKVCENILDNINFAVYKFCESTGYKASAHANSWYNVQTKGSILLRHNHLNIERPVTVSGALYINTCEENPPIVFECPNPYIFLHHEFDSARKYQQTYFRLQPKIGDLILFPSWLMHSINIPCKSDNRTVISFNYL